MYNIVDNLKCNGCHACVSICPKKCISMEQDSEGFFYPIIENTACIECNQCRNICPILDNKRDQTKCEPIAYATFNKDEEIRLKSSSGGVFTLIAEHVLKQGGVVFGACFDDKFNVVHNYTETVVGLEKFRGSKYVQSKIGDVYIKVKKFLNSGRLVLFTGTPCQIGGLKAYLNQEYDNLITQDLICHGVPSPKVWKRYVEFREKSAGVPAERIAFRHKKYGWKRYSVLFIFKNNTEYQQTLHEDLMMKAFLSNVCLRPSCYNCSFKNINRQSDVTLADFWGIENVLPEMDDDKGTSLLILNSKQGVRIFQELKEHIVWKLVDLEQAVSYNPSMIKSVGYNSKRKGFFEKIDILSFDKCVKKYCELSILNKGIRFPRRVVSKIKRAIFNLL